MGWLGDRIEGAISFRENWAKDPIHGYVKKFSSLTLDIKNMSEKDKLFNFLDGLDNSSQAKLHKAKPKDFASAISILIVW